MYKTGIMRCETIFRKMVKLYDVSDFIQEKKIEDIKVFKATDLFSPDSVFLGFGRPNVFLCYPENNSFTKFDAKSLKRESSKLTETKGFVQSGFFILFNEVTPEMVSSIKNAALNNIGSKNWTCVNSNCRVLEEAGFTCGYKPLSKFYFPIALMEALVENGLYYKGKKVEITFVRTVKEYLEDFGVQVLKSEWNTLYRHSKKYLRTKRKNNKVLQKLYSVKNKFLKKEETKEILEEKVVLFPDNIECKKDLTLTVSKPGKFGILFRWLWGPHAFFEVKNTTKTEELLPITLNAYAGKKKTFINYMKQYVLFSKPMIKFIRRHLCKDQVVFEESNEKDLYNMIRTHTDNIPNKYNLVITKDSISIIKIDIQYSTVDWVLSKHVLLSGYSKDVRFAGEFWKDINGVIHFNNNSGTYMPAYCTLKPTKEILNQLFPNIKIEISQEN